MNLFLVGMSYRTAPVAVRERYAVPAGQIVERDAKLLRSVSLDEGAILSTCNRTELIGASRAGEAALEVTALGMRVCGGAAYRRELGVERAFRDAQAASVMAPTTDHLYDFIGKAVAGLPLF